MLCGRGGLRLQRGGATICDTIAAQVSSFAGRYVLQPHCLVSRLPSNILKPLLEGSRPGLLWDTGCNKTGTEQQHTYNPRAPHCWAQSRRHVLVGSTKPRATTESHHLHNDTTFGIDSRILHQTPPPDRPAACQQSSLQQRQTGSCRGTCRV